MLNQAVFFAFVVVGSAQARLLWGNRVTSRDDFCDDPQLDNPSTTLEEFYGPWMREWKYLESRSFQLRSVVSEYVLRDCAHIVEIGAYRTPIDWFITEGSRTSAITIVEPLMTPSCVEKKIKGKPLMVKTVASRVETFKLRCVLI